MKNKEPFYPRGALLPMLLAIAIGGAQAMKQGDLEINVSLDKAAYAAYEDIILKVGFHNSGGKEIGVPALNQAPVTFALKDLATGKVKAAERRAMAAPGIPSLPPEPYALAAGKDVAYELQPATLLGGIPRGKFALQIRFDAKPAPFASDWLPFEVADAKIASVSAVPSAQGEAGYLRLSWRDDGGKTPRVLARAMAIGRAGEQVLETVSLGNADGTSAPVAATSPPGSAQLSSWSAWIADGKLSLGRIEGRWTAEYASALPEAVSDRQVIGLAYFPKPGDEVHEGLAGLVAGRDAQGIVLQGFESAAKNPQPAWKALYHASGALLDARLVPLSRGQRVVFLLRSDSGKIYQEALSWPEGKGFGAPIALIALPAPRTRSDAPPVFDAVAVNASAAWTLAAPAEDGKRFDFSSGLIDANGHAHPAKPHPAPASFSSRPGITQATLRLSPAGAPWILQRDAHGWWAQGGDLAQPRKLDLAAGADFVRLYFRNGGHAKAVYYVPGSGFATTAVIPDSGADNSAGDLR